jgi:prepilin-type N-terminal cleavage/methylation domain-containing protein
MKPKRGGFTMLEMLVVLMVGAVLIQLVVTASGPVMDRLSVDAARTSFASLAARARARAVERGQTVMVSIDPATDSAWVSQGTNVVEAIAFGTASGIDVRAPGIMAICMGPRGFGDLSCASFSGSREVTFSRGSATKALTMRPLGYLAMP